MEGVYAYVSGRCVCVCEWKVCMRMLEEGVYAYVRGRCVCVCEWKVCMRM